MKDLLSILTINLHIIIVSLLLVALGLGVVSSTTINNRGSGHSQQTAAPVGSPPPATPLAYASPELPSPAPAPTRPLADAPTWRPGSDLQAIVPHHQPPVQPQHHRY